MGCGFLCRPYNPQGEPTLWLDSGGEMGHVLSNGQRSAQAGYLDMLARIGVTKHFGDLRATEALARRCKIGAESVVLEVGCGVGLTACHLAEHYGCRIVAVDIFPGMAAHTRAEAQRRGVTPLIHTAAADAQALPLISEYFDVVLVESVSGFLADRALGFREYARMLKPGGYLGFTEPTWLATPTPDAERFVATLGVKPLEAHSWRELLELAGFEDIDVRIHTVQVLEEAQGCLQQYGCRGILRAAVKMVPLLIRSAYARTIVARATATVTQNVYNVLGYGVYAGRKP